MPHRPQAGFTYLMVLWWIAISSVVLVALGQQWAIETRRQREIELVFRGDQIRQALDAYYEQAPDGQAKVLPTRWEDLLEDSRRGHPVRHLRQVWSDPLTGGPLGVIRLGPYIKGVFSTAKGRPLRGPAGIDSYQSWRFELDKVSVQHTTTCQSSTNRHSGCID